MKADPPLDPKGGEISSEVQVEPENTVSNKAEEAPSKARTATPLEKEQEQKKRKLRKKRK